MVVSQFVVGFMTTSLICHARRCWVLVLASFALLLMGVLTIFDIVACFALHHDSGKECSIVLVYRTAIYLKHIKIYEASLADLLLVPKS